MQKPIYYIMFVIFLFAAGACENSDIEGIDLDAEILKEMDLQGIPSVVACMVDSAGIKWTKNYGFANKEYSIAATDETIYTLMSISKLFLAISVMQLWEKDLINLEEDINIYLPFNVRNPNFPDSIITPYMLLTHTSGLAWPEDSENIPDFHHFYYDEEPPLLIDWIPEYIFPEGENYRWYVWKDFPPGTKSLYSNIAVSLLALIVEQISGMDYRDYCRENILDPLEMTNSSFYLSELDYSKIATPYDNNNNPMWFYTCRHYPVGFLNCSLNDFAKFAQACLNKGTLNGKRILKESSIQKMLEVQNEQTGIAFLWNHYIGDFVGHIGGGTGFATCAEWNMEDQTAFFIFSNKYLGSVYQKGRIYELVKYQYSLSFNP